MAKKNKTAAPAYDDNNDDQIIAEGLSTIEDGVFLGDWQVVCDGLNSILGTDHKPIIEKKKTRLESIREMAGGKDKHKKTKNKIILPTEEEIENQMAQIESEDIISETTEEKMGNIKIISVPLDRDAKKNNEILALKKPRLPFKKRETQLKDNSNDDPGSEKIRLNLSNQRPRGE